MIKERKIFPDHDIAVADHNIVGEHGVLWSAEDSLQSRVSGHYDYRAVDHLPLNSRRSGYVLTKNKKSEFDEQMSYRGKIASAEFHSLSSVEELDPRYGKALYVPYIRLTNPSIQNGRVEWINYGLPPEITRKLKNKAEFHTWLSENGFENHVPNFIIAHAYNLPEAANKILSHSETMYKEAGLSYPLGVMIRAAESDGNFGSGLVKQLTSTEIYSSKVFSEGDIAFLPDGKSHDAKGFSSWDEALQFATRHVANNMNLSKEPRVVLTRYLDMASSPGLSAVVTEGNVHCLRWNGQWTEPGDTACTGTASYSVVGNERLSNDYEEQSQYLFSKILNKFLDTSPDRKGVHAMANMDIMLPGVREVALWKKAHTNLRLSKYLDARSRNNENYMPSISNPDNVLIAEINPRDTNWTLALKAVMQATHRDFSLESITELALGKTTKILARDAWKLPLGVSIQEAREKLLEYHSKLDSVEEGFILRMPDNPAGIIAWTHGDPNKLIQGAENALK